MRLPDTPPPSRPTRKQLSYAVAVLLTYGVETRTLADGRLVLTRGAGLMSEMAEGHEVVGLADRLAAAPTLH